MRGTSGARVWLRPAERVGWSWPVRGVELGWAGQDGRGFSADGGSFAHFGDYKIPTVKDIPPLTTVIVERAGGVGPYRIKGIDENPITPVAAAIANAVEDAVGVRIYDLPVTAEKVHRALEKE